MFSMEEMVDKQTCVSNTTSSALAMHKDSQIISKVEPKIRVIHIFEPEIIKTDVANFRELVQRLTGKPAECKNKKKPRRILRKEEPRALCIKPAGLMTKKMEIPNGFCSSEFRERIKGEEEEVWGGGKNPSGSGGGFLGGFADFDGFMKELNEFPLLPNLDALGEAQFA